MPPDPSTALFSDTDVAAPFLGSQLPAALPRLLAFAFSPSSSAEAQAWCDAP